MAPQLPSPGVIVGDIVSAIKGVVGAITKPIADIFPAPAPKPRPTQPSSTVPLPIPTPSPTTPAIIPFSIATSSPIATPQTTIPVPVVITSISVETENPTTTSSVADFSSSEVTTISSTINSSTAATSGLESSTADPATSATGTFADLTAVGSPLPTTSSISEHSETSRKLVVILPAVIIPVAIIIPAVIFALVRCRGKKSKARRSLRFDEPRSAAMISPFILPTQRSAPVYHTNTTLHTGAQKRASMGLSLETNLTGLRYQGHATQPWVQQLDKTHSLHSYSPITTNLASSSDFVGSSTNLGISPARPDDTSSPVSSLTDLAPLRMASESSHYPTTDADSDSDSVEPPTNLIARVYHRAGREASAMPEPVAKTEENAMTDTGRELMMLRQKVERLEGELGKAHRSALSTRVDPFNSGYLLDNPPEYASHVEARV